DFVDKVKNGADASTGEGWTPMDAYEALLGLLHRNTDNAAKIAELESKLSGDNNYGSKVVDNFDRSGPLGADWFIKESGNMSAGSIVLHGNNAIWQDSSADSHKVLARYIPEKSETDYQRVQIVLATRMEGRLFGVGNLCENFILGRADDAL